jgi:hypothetical protein
VLADGQAERVCWAWKDEAVSVEDGGLALIWRIEENSELTWRCCVSGLSSPSVRILGTYSDRALCVSLSLCEHYCLVIFTHAYD